MVKAYLRYEHSAQFGVVASGACGICFDADGKTLYSGGLENVNAWRIRQGTLTATLRQEALDETKAPPEATCMAHCPVSPLLAVGYADGSVRLWNTAANECTITLNGHRTAVTALAFNGTGSNLASGSKDTDIIVWDVVAESGLYRLRAHTDQVTALHFVDAHSKLLSTSKDGGLRVWDLVTQHCCQFIPNHAGEIWAMAVDSEQRRVCIGSVDAQLRLFHIGADDAADDGAAAMADDRHDQGAHDQGGLTASEGADKHALLRSYGTLRRETSQRVAHIAFSPDGAYLAASSAGKQVQLWHKRSPHEAAKKLKRRRKRHKEKVEKRAAGVLEGGEEDGAASLDSVSAGDEWGPEAVVRTETQVKSFAFAPHVSRQTALCQLALSLASNSVHVVNVLPDGESEVVRRVDSGSNRSDVRAVALSEEDRMLLSTGNGGTRIWNPLNGACLNSIETGYGLCCMFAPGGRFAVAGCKDGKIDVIDVGAASVIERVDAHSGQVWSLAALPGGKGFISGSADQSLKIWHWESAAGEGPAQRLGITEAAAINTGQDVLCVRVSPDGKLVAASLISNVIKVFYLDTMKWFVDLYGHKLPALTMDISSDSALLVSGSADKNIKIWGLDFGDCHKSLFAHQDSVMSVAFVNKTHYAFSAGKDKMVKYWDCDKFELLLELPAHHAEVWCLAVSTLGDFVISGSHDRSLRRWERTDEPFFIEEEKEKRLEGVFEEGLASERRDKLPESSLTEGVAEAPGHKTQESVSATDRIIEALDMAEAEAEAATEPGARPNPLMLGLTGSQYVLRAVAAVRANDLELVLLMLPFPDALKLLRFVEDWLSDTAQVELTVRVALLLLKMHHAQLAATPSARQLLVNLQVQLRRRIQAFKNVMGFNMAGLRHLQQVAKERTAVGRTDAQPPAKRKLAAL